MFYTKQIAPLPLILFELFMCVQQGIVVVRFFFNETEQNTVCYTNQLVINEHPISNLFESSKRIYIFPPL